MIGLVLIFSYFFPFGIISSTIFDPDYYFIASREGAAACHTSITLGVDSTFVERSVCFATEKLTGVYRINNDTVTLTFDDDFISKERIGVIKWKEEGEEGNYGYFSYYDHGPTEEPIKLIIIKLKK